MLTAFWAPTAPGTVLDLGGHTLGGDLPGGQLVLGVSGLVLRIGTLDLPDVGRTCALLPRTCGWSS